MATSILIENSKLKLEMEFEGGTAILRPIGDIDEDTNFAVILKLVTELGGALKKIRFDLGSVNRLNSCGVREWVLLMERIAGRVVCEFTNLNEVFVEQTNLIPSMLGKKTSQILSFQAPYFCPNCKVASTKRLDPLELKWDDAELILPEFACSVCSQQMEEEFLPQEYFMFLSRRR